MSRNLLSEHTSSVVNEDGELIQQTESKIFSVTGEGAKFYQVYAEVLGLIYSIKQFSTIKVLCKLLEKAQFDNSVVELSTKGKRKICEELEISGPTLYAAIAQLKTLGIIKGEGGYFDINPELIWRGSLKRRKDLIETAKCQVTVTPIIDEE